MTFLKSTYLPTFYQCINNILLIISVKSKINSISVKNSTDRTISLRNMLLTLYLALSQLTASMRLVIFGYFPGFVELAQYLKVGKTMSLIHDGYRYLKNGVKNDSTIYWKCSEYRFGCRQRATTLTINGLDMVKFREVPHTHPPTISDSFNSLDVKIK